MPENQTPESNEPLKAPAEPAPSPVSVQPVSDSPESPKVESKPVSDSAKSESSPAPARSPVNPVKFFLVLLFGLLGLFGILIAAMLFGLSAGDASIRSFGFDPLTFKNWTITLVNLFFGAIAMVAILFVIARVLGWLLGDSADSFAQGRRIRSAIFNAAIFGVTLGAWYGVYWYASQFITAAPTLPVEIVTEPANTLSLTSPIFLRVSAERMTNELAPFGDILAYEWDQDGDGKVDASGEKTQLYFRDKGANNGIYPLRLTVKFRPSGKAEIENRVFEKTVSIERQEIYGEIVSSVESGQAPLTVDFDAQAIADPDGAAIINYSWDVNNDGVADFDGAGFRRVSHIFEQAGEQTVRLTVTSGDFVDGAAREVKTFEKKIQVRVPAGLEKADAVIKADVTRGVAPLTIQFDGSESGRLASIPVDRYEWLINDGEDKFFGQSQAYTFKKAGKYSVTLRVRYQTGDIRIDTLPIEVSDPQFAPQAVISSAPRPGSSGQITGPAPLTVQFDGSESLDADDNIVAYEWDFNGDGKADATGSKASYKFAKPGEFRVLLRVRDADGAESEAAARVLVDPELSVVSFGASQTVGIAPLAVDFDASGSRFTGKEIASYEWEFLGPERQIQRQVSDRAQTSFVFQSAGNYTARLTLVATDGTRVTDEQPIIVNPESLLAAITASRTIGAAPLAISFDSASSRGQIVRREWTFGDGSTSAETAPMHVFQKAGQYQVVLRVYDAAGAVHTATTTITVN